MIVDATAKKKKTSELDISLDTYFSTTNYIVYNNKVNDISGQFPNRVLSHSDPTLLSFDHTQPSDVQITYFWYFFWIFNDDITSHVTSK